MTSAQHRAGETNRHGAVERAEAGRFTSRDRDLTLEIPARLQPQRDFVRWVGPARLSVEQHVVRVATASDETVFCHGRFDTALAWRRPESSREEHELQLWSTDGQVAFLAIDQAFGDEIGTLEHWLHLDDPPAAPSSAGALKRLNVSIERSLDSLEPLTAAWDDLAVRLDLPYCAPAWLLNWWRHVAPAGSELSVVVVRDGSDLVAIAPFYTYSWRGQRVRALLATDISSRVEPLVRPGYDSSAPAAIAQALHADKGAFDHLFLFGVPAESKWPERLRAAWPARRKPILHRRPGQLAPTVTLEADSVEAWLTSRSKNFRHQMRRFRRRLEDAGAVFRVATLERLEDDVASFERLHRGRWDTRGGTDAFPDGTTAMLVAAGRDLLPAGRFRLAVIEIDDRPIAAQLYLAAGSEVTVWNTGFDEAYEELRPSYVCLVDGIKAGIEGGYDRFDLGAGSQPYKYRFADSDERLEWTTLSPHGANRPVAMAALAPEVARYAVTSRLSPEQRQRLRGLAARQPLRRGSRSEPE